MFIKVTDIDRTTVTINTDKVQWYFKDKNLIGKCNILFTTGVSLGVLHTEKELDALFGLSMEFTH